MSDANYETLMLLGFGDRVLVLVRDGHEAGPGCRR
jgi:hypothetical protein